MRPIKEWEAPVLKPGRHSHPRHGACLVELSSTLPGGPWSDQPVGMDPVLGRLARDVNDLSSDRGRLRLIGVVPWLAHTSSVPRVETTTAIVTWAARAALRYADAESAATLAPVIALSTAGPERAPSSRRTSWREGRHSAQVLKYAARVLSRQRCGDELLLDLLTEAINIERRADGLPPVGVIDLPGDAYPSTLAVRSQLRRPDGGESTYLHCTAVINRWPEQLRRAWMSRVAELSAMQLVSSRADPQAPADNARAQSMSAGQNRA